MLLIDRLVIGEQALIPKTTRMEHAVSTNNDIPKAPDWLVGLWRRRDVIRADGGADGVRDVYWGQSKGLYVDVRTNADLPKANGRESFDEFSLDELRVLAVQRGFAGHIEFQNGTCDWVRYINFQPDTGRPDKGRLSLDGPDVLIEEGDPTSVLGSQYKEIYDRVLTPQRLQISLRLESEHDNRILVVLDDCFLYARARSKPLPPAESLSDLVMAAGEDRETIQAYLDCELSMGRIDGQRRWLIATSTLPFRVGHALLSPGAICRETTEDRLALECADTTEPWHIVQSTVAFDQMAEIFTA